MNEAGVALATVIIQIISSIFLFFRIKKAGGLQDIGKADFRLGFKAVREILGQAILQP